MQRSRSRGRSGVEGDSAEVRHLRQPRRGDDGRERGGNRARQLLMRRRDDAVRDRKSTRLNSSHGYISYAVFCLKKKTTTDTTARATTPPRSPSVSRSEPLSFCTPPSSCRTSLWLSWPSPWFSSRFRASDCLTSV